MSCYFTKKIIAEVIFSTEFGVLVLGISLCVWFIREVRNSGSTGAVFVVFLTPLLLVALALALKAIMEGNAHTMQFLFEHARNCVMHQL